MVYIKTTFFPYRLVLARKEPVQLTVDLRNDQPETKAYSVELEVGRSLSLERAGAKISSTKHIGNVLPGESKRFYYDIFAKAGTDSTSIPIEMRVHEHPKDSKGAHDIIQTFTRKLDIQVQNR